MGDSGIAHDNLPDGYWAREDIVVSIDGEQPLPVAQYAILPDYEASTVMVQIQTLPSAAGGGGRHTVHLQDANFRHPRPGGDAYLGARFRH